MPYPGRSWSRRSAFFPRRPRGCSDVTVHVWRVISVQSAPNRKVTSRMLRSIRPKQPMIAQASHGSTLQWGRAHHVSLATRVVPDPGHPPPRGHSRVTSSGVRAAAGGSGSGFPDLETVSDQAFGLHPTAESLCNLPLPLPADQPPRRVHGAGASPVQWERFHRLYQSFLEDRGTFRIGNTRCRRKMVSFRGKLCSSIHQLNCTMSAPLMRTPGGHGILIKTSPLIPTSVPAPPSSVSVPAPPSSVSLPAPPVSSCSGRCP